MSLDDRGELYTHEDLDIEDNYNVLEVSEIHAFEEIHRRQRYREEVASQINDYVDFYDVDEVWILGDTGDFNDAYEILNRLDDTEVKLVAGDEDKASKELSGRYLKGWFGPINSAQPFDVDVDYEIFDEGFETEIDGVKVQATHHPGSDDGEFFSVEKETNEKTLKNEYPPSMEDIDVAIYDHLHMPYERMTGPKAIIGLGGRRSNYQKGDRTELPEQSIHLASFDGPEIHQLHFDAMNDEIFSHNVFDLWEEEMYFVEVPRTEHNPSTGYVPLQSRFKTEHYNTKAKETEDMFPDNWKNHSVLERPSIQFHSTAELFDDGETGLDMFRDLRYGHHSA